MRTLIIVTLAATACAPAGTPLATPQDDARPNILFVMLDDLGKEWVSAYGAETVATPSIDALAADGLRFDNAWAMPQCTPTRIALLTGQPDEQRDLSGSSDPAVRAAYERLMAVARSFPDRDRDPQYAPRGPNDWDVDVTVDSHSWKLVRGFESGRRPAQPP